LVRTGCNDPSDLAQHQQVQLARRPEKSRCNIGAKRSHAITRTRNQVLKICVAPRWGLKPSEGFHLFLEFIFPSKGRDHVHAQF
ncbi:MAG: hypothetical protein RLZZ189_939, partial [Pseudomonadota bacterium]